MKLSLHLPPAERRGWSGQHEVSFDHCGGLQKWHHIELRFSGGIYIMHPTPWQLMQLVAILLKKRVAREIRHARMMTRYKISKFIDRMKNKEPA